MRKSKPDNSHRSRFSDGSLVIPGVDLGFKSAGGPGGRWCCALEDANFSVEGLVGTQLNGRTFGIVGLGKIGRVVAGIANGFGCKVIANDRTQTPSGHRVRSCRSTNYWPRGMWYLCTRRDARDATLDKCKTFGENAAGRNPGQHQSRTGRRHSGADRSVQARATGTNRCRRPTLDAQAKGSV